MPTYETYTCEECGDEFKALEGANAAESGHCSPKCATDARS